MTRIKASCPDCSEIDLTPDEVSLHIVIEADGSVSNESIYKFICPDCNATRRKPADERIVQLLLSGGVQEYIRYKEDPFAPLAPPHPEDPPDGPPFTLDNLLDFHLLLQQDDWFSYVEDS